MDRCVAFFGLLAFVVGVAAVVTNLRPAAPPAAEPEPQPEPADPPRLLDRPYHAAFSLN
jgi:hypothetical protein